MRARSSWFMPLALAVSVTSGACSAEGGDKSQPLDLVCETDAPVLQSSGAPTGFASCDEQITHRVGPATCEVPDPPEICEPVSGVASCTTSAECTDQPHGACLDDRTVDGSGEGCRCVYSCETDADCDAGRVCACLGDRPTCMAGECATDDDCGDGLCVIKSVSGACGGSWTSLVCLRPDDECHASQPETCPMIPDCNGGMSRAPCQHGSSGWTCGEFECGTSCG